MALETTSPQTKAESRDITLIERERSLPKLRGTPKQVVWARFIRNQILTILLNGLTVYESRAKGGNEPEPVYASLKQMLIRMESTADSAWWIERRSAGACDTFSAAVVDLTSRETPIASTLRLPPQEFARIIDRVALQETASSSP